VHEGEAHCRNIGSGETREVPVDDQVAARQFGEPIFPPLLPWTGRGPDFAPGIPCLTMPQ